MQISALRRRLSSALLAFAWEEWAQMGVFATAGDARPWAQDPEALLLLTFEVARDDPRLFDEVLDWLVRNESLVSMRRLRALSCRADRPLVEAVLRWVRLHRGHVMEGLPLTADQPEPERLFRTVGLPGARADGPFQLVGYIRPEVDLSGKSRAPDLRAPINFAFRLRQLLGVSARAEVVRYLLTATLEPTTVADVAASSGYAKRNVQEALSALASAGVVTRMGDRAEQRFTIDRSRWTYLLELDARQLPHHRDWPALLGAARKISRWLMRPEIAELSDYMRTSRAADLLDEIGPQLSRAGVEVPSEVARTGEDLEETVERLLRWLEPGSGTLGRPAMFEIVDDPFDGHRWRLVTAAGRMLVLSATAYRSEASARAALERAHRAPERLSFRVVEDRWGGYRWDLVADNGRVLGGTNESFVASDDAARAARDALELFVGAL